MTDHRSFLPQVQQIVCGLLAHELFGEKLILKDDIEWQKVYEECKKQAVIIPAFLSHQQLPLDEEMRQCIQNAVNNCVYQCIQNETWHGYLDCLMKENNIPYVVLKGAASAYYYPKPELRQSGDVDFLIHKEDIDRASAVLEKEGFQPWEEDHICHIVFRKGQIHYEMHFEPAGVPNGKAGEVIRKYLQDIQITAEEIQNETFSCQIPDLFHHGLILLLHMQHHLLSEGIGLRHLCDWAVFFASCSETEFKNIFQERLERGGLWQFAKIISLTAHMAVGAPYRSWMGEDYALAAGLLMDILSGGNFGSKDHQRMYEGIFISNRGKDGVRHSRIVQFIFTLNQVVYTHWPKAKRWKILLPPGWLFFGIRQIIRMATGKRRKIDFMESYQNSSKRKELYQQLRLFEVKGKK